ncbi:hypothetical protein QBC36DRAFT_189232 [Triangularia setosa]|uniref:Uncharacterized protein n=1 Tax=Triangularia setosa TaxID=2587417 RepID=A0AAN7A7Y0_9PEZI|nr:hypothetical protein QBC36DRAFT_189232 [Podospora setosa]
MAYMTSDSESDGGSHPGAGYSRGGGAPLYSPLPLQPPIILTAINKPSPIGSEMANKRATEKKLAEQLEHAKQNHTPTNKVLSTPVSTLTLGNSSRSSLIYNGRSKKSAATIDSPIVNQFSRLALAPPNQVVKMTSQIFRGAANKVSKDGEDDDIHHNHKEMRKQCRLVLRRIWGLREGLHMLKNTAGISDEFLEQLDYDIQGLINSISQMMDEGDKVGIELLRFISLAESYGNEGRKTQEDLQKFKKEQESIAEEYKSAKAELKQVLADNKLEVRMAKQRVKELEEQRSTLDEIVAAYKVKNARDSEMIEFLHEKLGKLEMENGYLREQVDGKRNLWMQVHKDPKERAAAMNIAMQSSTTATNKEPESSHPLSHHVSQISLRPVSRHGPHQVQGVRSFQSYNPLPSGLSPNNSELVRTSNGGTSSTPNGSHSLQNGHFKQIASGNTASAARMSSSRVTGDSWRRFTPHTSVIRANEVGSPSERHPTSPSATFSDLESPVMFKQTDQHTDQQTWANEFEGFFRLMLGFCNTHFKRLPISPQVVHSHIQTKVPSLYDYMCTVINPGTPEEGQGYALSLVCETATRPYYLFRLLLQHIVNLIFTTDGWSGFNKAVDEEMESLGQILECSKKPSERDAASKRLAELVSEIETSKQAPAFKNHKIIAHNQILRKMISPFIKLAKANQEPILHDLFTVTQAAWELSSKLLKAKRTFHYVFNDTGAKYSADVHMAVETFLKPEDLALRNYRIKLSITPVVTMRSDENLTIKASQILKAKVLVMP